MVEVSEKRRKSMKEPAGEFLLAGWEDLDLANNSYKVKEVGQVQSSAVVDSTKITKESTLSDIFCHFLTPQLLESIWDDPDRGPINYEQSKPLFGGIFNIKKIYQHLAIHVRIIGQQDSPVEGDGSSRALRDAISACRKYFEENNPDDPPLGMKALEILTSKFLIDSEHFEALSRNFQDVLSDLGQILAGDEKLLRFTGKSNDVRDIASKPDKLGLWFFELCTTFDHGASYLLHLKLWRCDSKLKVKMGVWQTAQDWARVAARHNARLKNPNTIVVFDSYYMTVATVNAFAKEGVMFMGSLKKSNFNDLTAMVTEKVAQAGDWAGVHCPQSGLTLVHKWDHDANIGKKYVLSNAFVKTRKSRDLAFSVPVYDLYKLSFNACDKYNRLLKDRKWPHRTGGNNRSGECGHHHKFAFASVLQNTFALWESFAENRAYNLSFQTKCLQLADLLYAKSVEN